MALNIGIIAHARHEIREPFAGGLECHTANLARALMARGHHVTLFSAGRGAADTHMEFFCRETEAFSGDEDGGFAYEHHAYQQLMESIGKRGFDIVHNNSLHYLPVAMANKLAMPMVTTLHTPAFWEMAGSIQLSPHANSFFVAVSETIRREWSSVMDVDVVIPNGVDLQKFAFQPIAAADPYLFWSGRIVPEKGLHLAIKAAKLAGIPLLFAGPVSDIAYFETAIRPLLGAYTRYMGHLDHTALVTLMGGARAGLCTPMWEEPYGLVVAEALACGTPVAGFARGALPDLVESRCGILVEPGDVVALAAAARAAQSLARSDCRRRAEDIADAGRMILEYEDLYYRLCSAAPSAARTSEAPWYHELLSRKLLRAHYVKHMAAEFKEVA